MNKQELQLKLNTLLLGKNAYNNYRLCDIIKAEAKLWFCDRQGYIGARLNNYNFTITYKDKSLVSFEIKRRKDNTYGWVVKEVIIDDDFVDSETSIADIHERYKESNKTVSQMMAYLYHCELGEITHLLRVIKREYRGNSVGTIKDLISALNTYFWNADEKLHEEEL